MSKQSLNLTSAAFANVTDVTAQEFIQFRASIRKPLTQGAFDRAMLQAAKVERELQMPADEAIQITIDKGWQGVTFEYIAAEMERRKKAMALAFPMSNQGMSRLIEKLADRSWADESIEVMQ